MTELIRAERVFNLDDQNRFAALSGDRNPLHVDPIAARRLMFGEPVVHGVHTLCWTLDVLSRSDFAIGAISRLHARFNQPVLLGRPVMLRLTIEPQSCVAHITVNDVPCAEIRIELGPDRAPAPPPPNLAFSLLCADKGLEAMRAEADELPLGLDMAAAAALLPDLVTRWCPLGLAAILATTRLVGMHCPGRHSLYGQLELVWDGPAEGASLAYQVTRAHAMGIVDMAVTGPGFHGRISTLVRPGLERQITMAEAQALVDPAEFSELRALVVGGSRGLGEVAAKLLAAGGADVTLTYTSGRADAQVIADLITEAAGRAAVLEFDVRRPEAQLRQALGGGRDFNCLLYFAAPKILKNSGPFDVARFASYRDLFVSGFLATAQAALDPSAHHKAILYPSTIFIDDDVPDFAEYVDAKIEGEAACRLLAVNDPTLSIVCPRLPRARTEQNAGFLARHVHEPADILLPWIRVLAGHEPGFLSSLHGDVKS